jgi:hypothetical protein
MAEEIRATRTNNNGERLEIRLGTRTLGVSARDIVSVLLVLGGVVGGYLLYTNVHEQLRAVLRHQEVMLDTLQDNRVKILEAIGLWRGLMDEQTQHIRSLLGEQEQRLEMQAENIRKLFVYHEMNQHRDPKDKIPLEFPMPMEEQEKAKSK